MQGNRAGSLAAHEVTKSFGAAEVLRRVSLVVSSGRPRSASSGRTGSASRRCCASSPGSRSPTAAGSCAPAGPSATCRRSRTPRPGETLRALPRAPHRRGGGRAASSTRSPRGCADEPELADAYTDALDRFLALGGDDLDARGTRRSAPRSGLPTDARRGRLDALSGGEAARAALAAHPAGAVRRAAARRADEQPRLRRPRPARAVRDGRARGARRRLARPGVPRPDGRRGSSSSRPRRGEPREYAGGWAAYERSRERGTAPSTRRRPSATRPSARGTGSQSLGCGRRVRA